MKHGDFSNLANNYSKYRPAYSKSILNAILGIKKKQVNEIDIADIGAGTGIWTRMLAEKNPKSLTAIEPNDNMRKFGIQDSKNFSITWLKGTGESTGLKENSIDLITVASCFHWIDFEKGIKEFHKILKKGGHFVVIYNPRYYENNKILLDINDYLFKLNKNIKRVSSGKTIVNEEFSKKIYKTNLFDDVIYIEGMNNINMSKEQYIGAWQSTNDIQVQLGKELFNNFLDFIQEKLKDISVIKTSYLNRAWIARKI